MTRPSPSPSVSPCPLPPTSRPRRRIRSPHRVACRLALAALAFGLLAALAPSSGLRAVAQGGTPQHDLGITATGSAAVQTGRQAIYTITLRNQGAALPDAGVRLRVEGVAGGSLSATNISATPAGVT